MPSTELTLPSLPPVKAAIMQMHNEDVEGPGGRTSPLCLATKLVTGLLPSPA